MFGTGSTIGRFRGPWGVPIEIDGTLILLVGIILYFSLGSNLIHGLVFAAMLVGSILLHELGHAWGSTVQGVPVKRVVIGGGGGFCEQAARPTPQQHAFIVAMGPIVNLAIWAFCGLAMWGLWQWAESNPLQALGGIGTFSTIMGYLNLLAWLNLALFAFNMIPVQPLDGGKLFHHLMARYLPPLTALRVTGAVGLVMSILWIPAAIWGFVTYGFLLFFLPSIRGHYRMMRWPPRGAGSDRQGRVP